MIDSPDYDVAELVTLGFPLPLGPGEAICDLKGCSLPGVFLTPDAVTCGACAERLRLGARRWHRPIPADALTGGEEARALRGEWYEERIGVYMPVERCPEIDRELDDLVERAVRRSLELHGYRLVS